MATKTIILDAIASVVAAYPTDPSETLTGTQETELCDEIAEILNDLNPNHQYPPVPKT
jgi:hypothetical protein